MNEYDPLAHATAAEWDAYEADRVRRSRLQRWTGDPDTPVTGSDEANDRLQRVTGSARGAWEDPEVWNAVASVASDPDQLAVMMRLVGATPDGLLDDLEEHYDCELCGEEETELDPLGHHRRPGEPGEYVLAHGQCGLDAGLEPA